MINKKKKKKKKIFEISLGSFFLSIGILSETFIRINNLVFFSLSIYIIIGMIFALWFGIIISLLIDTFQLLLRGLLSYWFWSLQIEPPIIILITFLIKKIITNLKNEKHFMIFSLILFLILISVFIYVLIQNIDNFSFTRKIYKSKLENNEKFLSRILVNWFTLIGFYIIFIKFIYEFYLFKIKRKSNYHFMIFIIILNVSLFIDWLFHPWAIQEWRRVILEIEYNYLLFRTSFLFGVFKSIFHIFISITIIPIIFKVYNEKYSFITKNKF